MSNRTRDWFGFGISRNVFKFAFIAVFFSMACDGGCDGCGCGGFENTPYPPTLYNETVQQSGQIRVTPTGLDFLETNIGPLVEGAVPGGLAFCVPEQSGTINACYADQCSTGETGCDLTLTIDDATLTPQPPNTLQVDVTVGGLDERLPLRVLGADCRVVLKSNANGNNPATIGGSVPISFVVDMNSPTRDVKIELGDVDLDLSDVDIDVEPADSGNIGQILACGATNFLTALNLVNQLLQGAVGPLLGDTIADLERQNLCTACDMAACPAGSTCAGDDICEFPNGECVPIPLGIEGRMLLGEALADFTEHPDAALDLMVKAADHASVNDGITIGMRSGYQPNKIERCAPVDPGKRPDYLTIPLSQSIVGNTKPNGQPFMFGIGYHRKAIQHMLWSTWASGATCLRVDQSSIGDSFNLSAGAISIFAPSIKTVARNDAALYIKITPQVPPDVLLGANTVTENGGSYTVNDPLMTIDWKDLDIHMYFFTQDRFTRVFTLRGDIVVPVAIVPDGMGQIVPVIGDISNALQNIRVQEAGMVAEEDQAALIDILPSLIGTALPSLLGSVSDPIELPELFGLEFDFQEGDITSVDNNEMIALYASLRAAQMTNLVGLHTGISEQRVDFGHFPSGVVKPNVELDMFPIMSVPDHEADIEYAYRVDDGWWGLFEVTDTLRIEDPVLLIPGEHTIEVKARLRGAPETTTMPIVTKVMIDWDKPQVEDVRLKDHQIKAEVYDMVDKDHQLQHRFRIVGEGLDGAWTTWGESAIPAPAQLPELIRVDVESRDRAGNIGEHTQMIRTAMALQDGPVKTGTTEPKSGCATTGSQPTGWLGLLVLLGIFGLRRRRINPAWLLAGFIMVSGCSCDEDEVGTTCDCPSNTYCNEDKECVPGCVGNDDCSAGKICEDNQCVDDCALLCAGSCSDTEIGQCSDGECTCVTACEGGCEEDEFCCHNSNSCENLPNPCSDQVCEPGFEPAIQDPPTGDEQTCETTEGTCGCVELPPLPIGLMAQYLDVYQNAGVIASAGYNSTYEDLVVAIYDASLEPTYHWVDGVPSTGTIAGALTGPRGGISSKGDDLGTHTSIVVDDSGNLHVFYRDEENDNLKYARGTGGPEYSWEFTTIDATPGSGFWTDAELVGGVIHLVYLSDRQDAGGGPYEARLNHATLDPTAAVSGLTVTPTPLVTGPSTNPCGIECDRRDECFGASGTCERPTDDCGADCPTGSACLNGTCTAIWEEPGTSQYAATTGLHTQLSRTPDGLLLTFYDNIQGSVGWLQYANDTWGAPQYVGAPSGPYGSGFVDGNGNLHLVYMDVTQPALVYQDVTNATTEIVVEGVRDLVGQYYVSEIGEDATIRVDSNGDVVVSYGDASLHTLNVAIRSGGNWSTSTVAGLGDNYDGAHGFYSSLWQVADTSLLIERNINQQAPIAPVATPDAYQP